MKHSWNDVNICTIFVLQAAINGSFTDVSEQPTGPIFDDQDPDLADGTDRLSRNVGKKLPFYAVYNPKERGSHLHGGGTLKSRSS